MRRFILGTDWWTDCDDAVAMRLLTKAHNSGEIQLLGIIINACMEYSAASLDGFLALDGCRDIPIGIDVSATDFGGRPPYQKRLSASSARYFKNEDAEDGVRLYRRLLADADGKVELIDIGFLQVVSALLLSEGDDISPKSGIELFREKVSKCWVMAGKWDKDGERENNFCRNERASRAANAFCELCPVPITFLGFEVGVDVISGGAAAESDHLHMALADHGCPNGRSSWDPMLALMALIGDEGEAGYDLARGRAHVDAEDGSNYFSKSESGNHAYVIKKFENKYYEDAINSRIV